MELTKVFTPDQYDRALESWAWLGLTGKTPLLSSLFGDVFLSDESGIWFLNRFDGTLECHWANSDALVEALATHEGMDEYLLGGLAIAIEAEGNQLAEDQVYDFMPPPALGGSFEAANAEATDMIVTMHIAGRLARQIQDIPAGTPVSKIRIDGGPAPTEEKAPGLLSRFGRKRQS